MPEIRRKSPEVFWQTRDGSHRLYHGNAVEVLRRLPSRGVHCVVTSPPYFGQRNYQTNSKDEIGLEGTVEEYVANLVAVFGELRRVMRLDGTAWLNIGDKWGKDGSVLGVPWKVAEALRDDGWVLRQDVIWSKPSPMRESVRDRCTKSHEYLFMLIQGGNYFFDQEAIKTDATPGTTTEGVGSSGQAIGSGSKPSGNGVPGTTWSWGSNANKLSVWTVSSGSGFSGSHFAGYPPALIEPCILAGTSEKGACAKCGAPWERMIKRERYPTRPGIESKTHRKLTETQGSISSSTLGSVIGNRDSKRHLAKTETVGWQKTCGCDTDEVVPCTVLDPFIGSGTTSIVCLAHGRNSIGIDLSRKYLDEIAAPRIAGELRRRPGLNHLA